MATKKDLNIQYVDTDSLIPYVNNARRHSDEQVSEIAASIKEFGFNNPILIDGKKGIIAGHGRIAAAKKLGLEKVPVIELSHLSDAQRRAYILADNRLAEKAEWDFELVQVELEALKYEDFNIELTGFDLDDVLSNIDAEPVEAEEDEIPEPQPEALTKKGDIWTLGDHRLMCGDSTSITDVEKLMDGEKADMVFTDPPYGVSIGDKNKVLNSFQKAERCCENIANDTLGTDELYDVLVQAMTNCRLSCKDDASYYVTAPQGGGLGMMMMMMMMRDAGLETRHTLMWLKNSPTFSMGRLDYDYKHEPILYTWTKSHNFYGKGEFTKSVWEFDKPLKCDLHPTMKPVALVENALLNSSKRKDIILDMFGGSGTTLIASEQQGRKARLMELSEHYCDVIIRRWQNLTGKDAVRDDGKTYNELAG